jgi:subtilase family serine protease
MLAPNNFAWAAYPPNKKYFHMGGTSMATPLVAGAVALVREFLRTKQGIASPTAALVKALLIAGAQRLPGTAPAGTLADNAQGFGRVHLDRALKQLVATIEGPSLSTGKKSTFTIAIPSTSKTVRIAMAYTDAPGETLVNNLNLMVTDASGKRYLGNQSASSSTALTLDTTNNVEVVQVSNPKKGAWTIDVVASNVSHGPQDFAIAVVLV